MRHMRIATKLALVISLPLAATLVVTAVALVHFGRVEDRISAVAERDIPLANAISKVSDYQLEQALAVERMLRIAGQPNLSSADRTRLLSELDHDIVTQHMEIHRLLGEAVARARRWSRSARGRADGSELQSIARRVGAIEHAYGRYKTRLDQATQAVYQGRTDDLAAREALMHEHRAKLREATDSTSVAFAASAKNAASLARSSERAATATMVSLSIVALLAATAAAVSLSLGITRPLRRATAVVDGLARGERGARLEAAHGDETGDLITAIHRLIGSVHTADAELRRANEELEERVAERTAELTAASDEMRRQNELVHAMSTPVVNLSKGVILLPLIGVLDAERAARMIDALLRAASDHSAVVAILDVTGVAEFDAEVAHHIVHASAACRVLGTDVLVTGLSAKAAQTIVDLGVDVSSVRTAASLQTGLRTAFELSNGGR